MWSTCLVCSICKWFSFFPENMIFDVNLWSSRKWFSALWNLPQIAHDHSNFPADITGDWLAPAGMLTYQSQILYNHLCPSCLPSSTIEVKSAEPLYSFGSMYVLMGTRCTNRYSIEYTMERTDVNILLAECRSMITSYNSAPKQTNSGKP